MAVALACRPAPPEKAVLARMGDETITPEEFRLNYEFGHGHLRRGDDPKRTYLQYMLLEKAMAHEALARKFDTLSAIRHAEYTLREELLIEEVFQTRVLDAIEVTDEEIRAEINTSAVRFQFRFLPATGEVEAWQLHEAMKSRGYEAVLADRQAEIPELAGLTDQLTSPMLDAESVDPELMAILQNLEIHTPSEPVTYRGNWYVMEVTDIRRERLAEEDYARRAPSARKVIYNRKAMEQGAAFVASTMEPLGVATKRAGLEILAATLWDWYREDTPERNLLHYIEEQRLDTPYTRRLLALAAEPLVTFRGEAWTIRDFLVHFTPGRYILRPDDPRVFKARLSDIVALVVRDAVLLEMAEKDGLDRSPAVERSLRQWKEKWLFQEYARWLDKTHAPTDPDLSAYYDAGTRTLDEAVVPFDSLTAEQRSRLAARLAGETRRRVADSLLAGEQVWIDEHMLDTLTLNVSATNPTMTVNLLKSNSNKPAFPVVDPNWRF